MADLAGGGMVVVESGATVRDDKRLVSSDDAPYPLEIADDDALTTEDGGGIEIDEEGSMRQRSHAGRSSHRMSVGLATSIASDTPVAASTRTHERLPSPCLFSPWTSISMPPQPPHQPCSSYAWRCHPNRHHKSPSKDRSPPLPPVCCHRTNRASPVRVAIARIAAAQSEGGKGSGSGSIERCGMHAEQRRLRTMREREWDRMNKNPVHIVREHGRGSSCDIERRGL
ncbi:hypothetical protein GUJ93_ZPchr0008g12984 [Zizania palustris]|uniref:Uncharacterized protein n=1 Tax=Zizania palustris TaxID=103762 RepID=A0A8J5RXC1_ZIZPA|nr:hypothetical protein GUJ93_ZPchr0008g12984 [Zizania palustris]